MTQVGLFFGTQTGNTESIAEQIQQQLGGENIVTLNDVSQVEVGDFAAYSAIIIGCPTWNIGEMQSDWDGLYNELDNVDFSGKKVAYFGPGDQVGYADNFLDAIGILEEKITAQGGETVGYWPIDGYDFNESKAVRGDKLVGLGLDEDNQPELTAQRIQAWTAQLKREFGL
jgi:flavodoxin I